MVLATVQGVCWGDILAGGSMGCLPQSLKRLRLTTSNTLPRTIPDRISFEQALYMYFRSPTSVIVTKDFLGYSQFIVQLVGWCLKISDVGVSKIVPINNSNAQKHSL
jgi:hypothetical protein